MTSMGLSDDTAAMRRRLDLSMSTTGAGGEKRGGKTAVQGAEREDRVWRFGKFLPREGFAARRSPRVGEPRRVEEYPRPSLACSREKRDGSETDWEIKSCQVGAKVDRPGSPPCLSLCSPTARANRHLPLTVALPFLRELKRDARLTLLERSVRRRGFRDHTRRVLQRTRYKMYFCPWLCIVHYHARDAVDPRSLFANSVVKTSLLLGRAANAART
jgi:hypothetical protein